MPLHGDWEQIHPDAPDKLTILGWQDIYGDRHKGVPPWASPDIDALIIQFGGGDTDKDRRSIEDGGHTVLVPVTDYPMSASRWRQIIGFTLRDYAISL